jgi:hypothetical protein
MACAAAVLSVGAAAMGGAEECFQLCLQLEGQPIHRYFLNFAVNGGTILVGGMKRVDGRADRGAVVGSMARTVSSGYEMGLTVTFPAAAVEGAGTERIVFNFNANGTISYRRWLDQGIDVTQGTATIVDRAA